MDKQNNFGELSAESAESRYAQFTPEEHAEASDYYAQRDLELEIQRECRRNLEVQ